MNKLKARVTGIESIESVTIVTFQSHGDFIEMLSLGLEKPLQVGSSVLLGVKSSSIALATNLSTTMSISNQLRCVVDALHQGELLCSVRLRFHESMMQSIITMQSALKMDLKVGDSVVALIQASELSLLEVEG